MKKRVGAAVLLASLLAAALSARADSDALWRIVHDRCVPDQRQHGDPAPCARVSLSGGWVVLKDRRGIAQYLLIPTARVTGIEDKAVLAPDAPNYFAAAWAERDRTQARLPHPLPREALSLAVNSPTGRSQNQLHIHIDCLRGEVRAALARQEARIGTDWAPLPDGLRGHRYIARRIADRDLAAENPFRLLADWPGVGEEGLGHWTLAVVGAPDGFILLADHGDPATGDRAESEELQDHACALAQAADG